MNELIGKIDRDAVEVKGSMNVDKKEEILLAFADGQIKKLITKASITAFGLNWQHCNHTTYFPTYSYEQWYQAIRRFWRFGQTREVYADMVLSDGQTKLLRSLSEKMDKADQMFGILTTMTQGGETATATKPTKEIVLPKFI